MIKLLLKITFIVLLFSVKIMTAQEFTGRAVYESKTTMDAGSIKINGKDGDDAMVKKLQEQLDKMNEKTFVMDFNKTESIYAEEQKLDAPSTDSGFSVVTSSGVPGKLYKNVKDKSLLSEEDFFDKEFLVSDVLPDWDWKLQPETKKIGDYTCQKATAVIAVTAQDKADYEDMKKQQENGKTQFFVMDEPKDRTVTVWYTPEIPVSHGPDKYWGLPGLILEVNADKTHILCSKIIVNPKDKVVIKLPKKGKKVNRKEYEVLMEKQMNQMKDADGNITIEIQR